MRVELEILDGVTASAHYVKERPGTMIDPPEGGYCEDLKVMAGEIDITELVDEKSVLERLEEKAHEDIQSAAERRCDDD